MSSPGRENNFDLIRLLAAVQVVLVHAIGHTPLVKQLSPLGKQLFRAFEMLPGVPVFFVISGFLITRSFERDPSDLRGYLRRRGLRIFPGLWMCLAVTLAALGIFGFLGTDFLFSKTFAAWLAGQISFFQFYNPEHFRGFGTGVANGALWTITVELQFYAFIPLFHKLAGNRNHAARILTAALFLLSFTTYCVMDHKVNGRGGFGAAPVAFKLLHVTLLPHLWMFMLGILIHWNFDTLRKWLEGKFLLYFAAYALFMWGMNTLPEFRSVPYYLGYLPSRALLAFCTISAAFSAPYLSRKLLHGMDLSYGTYLYHSVVINILIQLGMLGSFAAVAPVYAISFALALLSWHLVEKPALALKFRRPGLARTSEAEPAKTL